VNKRVRIADKATTKEVVALQREIEDVAEKILDMTEALLKKVKRLKAGGLVDEARLALSRHLIFAGSRLETCGHVLAPTAPEDEDQQS
jgi:hypothetical protein